MNVSGQTSDTLRIHFSTNSEKINNSLREQIKSFVNARNANTRFNISAHTDNVGDHNTNEVLSYKRELEVYNILIQSKIDSSYIQHQHFAETKPLKPNTSDANKAVNRRVEIIKFNNKPINNIVTIAGNNSETGDEKPTEEKTEKTFTQPNGIIIEYTSGNFPIEEIEESIRKGGNPFGLIQNTTEMQKNNMLTTTTDGTQLSSLVIFCPPRLNPCQLDTPIVVKIPINNSFDCPLNKIIFLNAKAEEGKNRWKEANTEIFPEIIGDKQYISVSLLNVCECINFDYKIELPCFATDTVYLKFPRSKSASFEIINNTFNSVSQPKRINKTTIQVIIPKGNPKEVFIDASLSFKSYKYDLKQIPLARLPYSSKKKHYYLSKTDIKSISLDNKQ